MEYFFYIINNSIGIRNFVYIFFGSLALVGLILYCRRPWPFGYRDPLHLLKHNYKTYGATESAKFQGKIEKIQIGGCIRKC